MGTKVTQIKKPALKAYLPQGESVRKTKKKIRGRETESIRKEEEKRGRTLFTQTITLWEGTDTQ